MNNAQAAANARKPYADAIKRIEAEKARMQNAINWAARAGKMQIGHDLFGYFIGHISGELHALDDGAPLIEPKVQPNHVSDAVAPTADSSITLATIRDELATMGFGTDQDIDGGDFVEYGGELYADLVAQIGPSTFQTEEQA